MGIVAQKDGLTRKSRKFVKAKLLGMTHADAARIAYPKAKEPKTVGKQVAKRPAVQAALKDALNDNNVTPSRIAQVVDEGLSAEREDFQGNKSPDHVIRHKFTETAIKVYGGFAPELHAHAHKVSLTDEMLSDLEEGKING